MGKRRHGPQGIAYLLLLFFLTSCLLPPSLLAADEDKPTLEEIAKTEAAKLYIAERYRESLAEFQKLEAHYPKSLIIKRYIASLYDALRDWDGAAAKLKEALALKSDDLISRQLLGETYMKQAEFDKAAKEFEWIVGHAPESAAGQYAAKKLEDIRKLKTVPTGVPGKQIGVQEFMQSPPARAFAKGNYGEALPGFDQLLTQYPEDVLIRRFRAISLLRLKRREEAIRALEEALGIEPENVALHFYLGQAFLENDKTEEARKEFQWVIAHDEASYKARAEQAVFQTLRPAKPAKPLTVTFTNGYEFHTNATFKPRDDRLNTAGDMNSSVFNTSLIGTYRLYQKRRWTLTADALYNQSLYVDFPHLQAYTAGGGLSALYVFNWKGKPAAFNLRDGATYTILKNKFFVFTHSVTSSFIYNTHRRVRTTLTYRWNINEYDSSGSDPPHTNRDGFAHIASLMNTFYFNDKKTFYLNGGYEFERHDTSGKNFIKNVHGGRAALHFPLFAKIETDWNFRYRRSNFNQYAFSPPKRRDDLFSLTIQASRPITDSLTLIASYAMEDVTGRNNLYEYRRHIFGVQIAYKY